METYAKVICDSISPIGCRLTSIEVQFPRFVLPQLAMHRMFSRSCESLRARPTKSKLAEVEDTPYVPKFRKNIRGMVAGDYLDDATAEAAVLLWRKAAVAAANYAEGLAELGVAKEVANRLLEPFAYQKVLITSTDFANWFRLRIAADAQDEISELARRMKEALDGSEPKLLKVGDWHQPYILVEDVKEWRVLSLSPERWIQRLNDISSARCARISYCTHDGKRDHNKDLALADDLIDDGHSNPTEHPATPACDRRRYSNFRGWISYRYQMENDGRLPNPEG